MTSSNSITRRSAVALATVLTATFLTGIAAVGGLTRWHAQSGVTSAAVVQAPSPVAAEVDE
jgi:hypothetical protein